MPPIIVAFFVMQALGHGHTAAKELMELLPDGGSYKAPLVMRAWSAPAWDMYTRSDHCDVTFIAYTNRRSEILTDQAFAVGHSLTVNRELLADRVITKHFLFSNPDPPHEVYGRRKAIFRCFALPGSGATNRGLTAGELEGY